MTAIFTIVGSAQSRHISPCIAADRDWITKKNQKAKHSMSNPARRRKLPGGVFFADALLTVCACPFVASRWRRMSGETQLKPFFFADEAIFTATCIPLLNHSLPAADQEAAGAAQPGECPHLLALDGPLQLDATRGSRKPATQTSLEEQPVKTCFQCQGKLGLAIRARNLWNGRWWWSHVYFCSARCEDRYELEQSEANAKPQKLGFFARGSAQL